jgi:hypothetical protein
MMNKHYLNSNEGKYSTDIGQNNEGKMVIKQNVNLNVKAEIFTGNTHTGKAAFPSAHRLSTHLIYRSRNAPTGGRSLGVSDGSCCCQR